MRRVAVLGSTGSIGRQALEVIEACAGSLSVHSLLCRSNAELLSAQAARFSPAATCMLSPQAGRAAPSGTVTGDEAIEAAIEGCDIVLNAITGFAGLRASLVAAALGRPLALANKESLVTGGVLLREHLDAGLVIPVDSEHSTIARCLEGASRPPRRIILTASGGALRDLPPAAAAAASPAEVLSHPTWDMGPRITVDSATLVNKAFEVIEAGWLFPGVETGVLIHPRSIVHSLVEMEDGSYRALLGVPDMRVPIQHALLGASDPRGFAVPDDPVSWPALEFSALDHGRYPAFGTVIAAGTAGGTAPAAANAADEVAVAAFLAGEMPFGGIAEVVAAVMAAHGAAPVERFEDVVAADARAREEARRAIERIV